MTVTSSAAEPVVASNSSNVGTIGDGYIFSNPLDFASKGTEVTELQKRLTALGIYSGPITGYYGSLTVSAIKQYQSAHGLSALGNLGPATRADLNNGK